MADLTGRRLSHYQITAALGSGGMGEVYRATDTNLNREVAISTRFMVLGRDPSGGRLSVFFNWTEELKRIVAAGGVR